jgi:bifunctional non-homologous end joining protein LigD
LARYFEACAAPCLDHLGRRPLTLVRSVDGITFFHKGPLPPCPETVKQLKIVKADGTMGTRLWVDNLAGLLGLVALDVVELHPWGATVDDIEHPDRLIFDLDPDDGVPWNAISTAAMKLRDHLASKGLPSWPKTTGGKGLHVVVPVSPDMDWSAARAFTKSVAHEFESRDPQRYTAKSGANARRGGRIFIDWLRNGRGQTALGAMSPRARAGGRVSMPVTWAELESANPEGFTLASLAAPDRRKRSARMRSQR